MNNMYKIRKRFKTGFENSYTFPPCNNRKGKALYWKRDHYPHPKQNKKKIKN